MKYATADKVLLKDIVIPAGTIFRRAPSKTTRDDSHYDCLIGLTDDTCGSFVYPITGDDEELLKKYFADVG